jgi:carbonic anhydrase
MESKMAEKIWQELLLGNERFVQGQMQYQHQDAERRQELLSGQHPLVAVLCCSDSRVPPEVIFDQGLGDLFVVRTAGNVVDDVALGSLEYAVEHLHVHLLLVLGHSRCGAVTAAVQGGDTPGHIGAVLDRLAGAVQSSGGHVAKAVDENIRSMVAMLRTNEPILAEAVAAGQLLVLGARYDLEDGYVRLVA